MNNFTFGGRIPFFILFLFLFISPMLLSGQCAPDTEDPDAKCKDISPYWEIGNALIITAADVNNGSTDNCGIASMTLDKYSFNCDDLGDNTVTLTVTDNAGNTKTCTSTVLVRDNIAPSILCIDPTPTYTNSTEAFVTVPTPLIGDNCALAPEGTTNSGITAPLTNDYTNTKDASTPFPYQVGVTQVGWTVYDKVGNFTDCYVDVKVINGEDPNITLSSQAELNDFVSNYFGNPITTNLTISGADITDLSGLKNLRSISGDLRIEANDNLTNIDGLEKLESIGGGLIIYGNPALSNLDGLCNLTTIGGLNISGNLVLANLDGLQNLNNIGGGLNISFNDILTNIDGLQGLNEIGGSLYIVFNDALTNIDGLQNLSAINGRFMRIASNGALTEYCGLYNLSTSVPIVNADIYNNADNPSLEEIANGEACSRILLPLPKEKELPALSIPYLVLFGLTLLGVASVGMRRLV